VGSDGHIYDTGQRGHHPRAFGAFARFLARCRDDGWLTLEQGIRKLTSQAACRFRFPDSGRIADGVPADLCLFDPGRVKDRASFREPSRAAEGVAMTFLGGRPTFRDGRVVGRHGRLLGPCA
jgi:N-acyl-D-aspartate/D-glutamate deacylase